LNRAGCPLYFVRKKTTTFVVENHVKGLVDLATDTGRSCDLSNDKMADVVKMAVGVMLLLRMGNQAMGWKLREEEV